MVNAQVAPGTDAEPDIGPLAVGHVLVLAGRVQLPNLAHAHGHVAVRVGDCAHVAAALTRARRQGGGRLAFGRPDQLGYGPQPAGPLGPGAGPAQVDRRQVTAERPENGQESRVPATVSQASRVQVQERGEPAAHVVHGVVQRAVRCRVVAVAVAIDLRRTADGCCAQSRRETLPQRARQARIVVGQHLQQR